MLNTAVNQRSIFEIEENTLRDDDDTIFYSYGDYRSNAFPYKKSEGILYQAQIEL